jgi:hypothetical protein
VTDTLQLEPETITHLHHAPKLLVEWPPRWQEFKSSIRPAFARSGRRLAGEAPLGIYHYRGLIAALLLQAFLVFILIVLPREVQRLRPYAAPRLQAEQVIYYSADELPRTEDLGGAASGASGHAGGREAHHRTQTIHVARGKSLAQQVVDAPNLKLPVSTGAVANLLAFKSVRPIPGPPPAEGLHSSVSAPNLPANVIAPPSNVSREPSRRGVTLTSIVPPAPDVSSSHARSAPSLNSAIVPPAPSVQSEHPLYVPKLDASIIGPAPNVNLSRDRSRSAPALNSTVIAPASIRISSDQMRSAPALRGSVIAPAPTTLQHEVSPSRVEMNNVAVVPPPVSAPEHDSGRVAKLTMPTPSGEWAAPVCIIHGCSSAAYAGRQRILRQQHHREAFWHTGCRSASAVGLFGKHSGNVTQLRWGIGQCNFGKCCSTTAVRGRFEDWVRRIFPGPLSGPRGVQCNCSASIIWRQFK